MLESPLTAFNERFVDFASIDDICFFFASPFTVHPDVCQKVSQMFGDDEAGLQDDLIDCAGVKQECIDGKNAWCCSGRRKDWFGF